jgi:SAM-dependent methyltransferase
MSDERWADATVAAIDIARLAGVGKAAVGNWRRRFADFPDPVAGTASSPLYRLGDVERWLTHHGRAIRVSAADRVWQWLRTETDDLRLGELMGHLGAFLVYLHRRPDSWKEVAGVSDGEVTVALGRAVAAAVPELPGEFPGLPDPEFVSALRTIADVVVERGAASTFEFLVERYLDAHARRIQPTPAEAADVMVRLAQVTDRSVLDPACGTGALLTAAAAAGATSVAGQDADRARTRITGARLLLAGVAVEMASGDPLLSDGFAGRRFGAVVCNPSVAGRDWGYDELAGDPRWEYGLPPRGEPELAWAQHCLAHTEPGGLAVVAMPPTVAVRRPGRRIRGNLLRAGALRAVVSLRLDAGATSDLWVLQRPLADEAPPAHVLMAVADDAAAVPRLWEDFRAEPAAGNTPQSRTVRIIDLLDEDVDVSPARHLPGTSAEAEIDYGRAREDLLAGLRGLADTLPDLTALSERRELPMTTVGELAKVGMVTLAQAPLRMTIDEGELPVLTVKDVSANRPPTGRTRPQPGLVVLEAGDVVAPVLAKETWARVVTDGGAVLGPRLMSFRVDPERLDPHFLAGFLCLAGAAAGSRTTTGRSDVRRIAIPRLPIEEQRAYGTALSGLIAFQDALRSSASAGELLVRLGLTGLADGTLAPGR